MRRRRFLPLVPPVVKQAQVITLVPTDKRLCFDQRARYVALEKETDEAWHGKPIDNPACPSLKWLKFAWERSDDTVATRKALSVAAKGNALG